LVRQSIQNGQQAWTISKEYACVKRVTERQLDAAGAEKSKVEDAYSVIPLGYGASFDEPMEHNGERPSEEVRLRAAKELDKLRAEPTSAKRHQFEKDKAERIYMSEVPEAFNFRITGTETLATGPAWVIEATPRPDFEPKSRYAHVFAKMQGTLWIDQKDLQWVKADAVAVENVSFGLFIARLAKGSHILLEQTKLPDGDWVPKTLEARAEARIFVLFQHNFQEKITYNNYRKLGPLQADAR
jgi:hypothetical protein